MMNFRSAYSALAMLSIALIPNTYTFAADEIEEVVVTARQQAESLQDVPVTIAALTEEDLDRYHITNLVDASKMVPNMVVAQAGSGNNSSLSLRGIGSSSISAAFDHSVALNLDGVVVNRGRFIHNSYLDMGQLEILKGPQSLYFGKSATAGVVSITTNDPGDEFELQASGGVETEFDGQFAELIVSGPVTDTLGARLAVGFIDRDELFKNYSAENDPRAPIWGTNKYNGDESINARLTLVWTPTDNFTAKLKYNYSEYENSGGPAASSEEICPEGAIQGNGVPAPRIIYPVFGVDDCKINGNSSIINLHPDLRAGLPRGFDDGQERLEQDTDFISLQADWDFHENYTLTSVTGYVDLSQIALHDASYGAGLYGGLAANEYESLSQEFRLASDLNGPVNFQVGLYYQEIEQEFNAWQGAATVAIVPYAVADIIANAALGVSYADFINGISASTGQAIVAPLDPASGFIGADPFTGNDYDWNKNHFLDSEAFSAFFAIYWDITENLELTIGSRYTDEQKEGYISTPYLHAASALFGFGVPPRIDGLEFEDDNLSSEVALNYHVNDDISVFAAYKEAFKSGGVDNSAFPNGTLNPAVNGGDFSFLVYDSEEADGFEIGTKANLLDNAMRFNATIFSYEYSDLQTQQFNPTIINFQTFNASAIETRGFEFDLLWLTDVEGLSIRSAWAYTNTEYTDDFITAIGENLRGKDVPGNADWTGFVGGTYEFPVGDNWGMSLSADARYKDDYAITSTLDPLEQDSFWILDAAISIYTNDYKHQFNLIGRNVNDELVILGAGGIPGKCPNLTFTPAATCTSTGPNSLDQAATVTQGRAITLQYRYTM